MISIIYISPEVTPLSKTGGLGDVSEELPKALARAGARVDVMTLKYQDVDESKLQELDIRFPISIRDEEIWIRLWKVVERRDSEPNIYLLDANRYSERIYQGDELKQAILLSQGSIEATRSLWEAGLIEKPDVMHANDWPTALVPVYLKTKYAADPVFEAVASIYAIHNLKHQGGGANGFSGSRFHELGIADEHWFGLEKPEDPQAFNLVKGAILHANKIVTVSRTYANEILTTKYGAGLHKVLRGRRNDIVGILNGVDSEKWQPVTIEGKPAAKEGLQREFGLTVNAEVPILGSATRIAAQKGTKSVLIAVDRLLRDGEFPLQFAFSGSGHAEDSYFHECLVLMERLMNRWPNQVVCKITKDPKAARLVFAGIDLYLMPSEFEPAGTKQQVALLNATPVVATKTGGLIDTVWDFSDDPERGNGFVFDGGDDGLHNAIARALDIFCGNKRRWKKLMENTQLQDRSWHTAAKEYFQLYQSARAAKRSQS